MKKELGFFFFIFILEDFCRDRDGRKWVGVRREMEEAELEEGEACCYENNGSDENSFVDPDALTHIVSFLFFLLFYPYFT